MCTVPIILEVSSCMHSYLTLEDETEPGVTSTQSLND